MSDLVLIDPNCPLSVKKNWAYDLPYKEHQSRIKELEAVSEVKAIEKALKEFENEELLVVNRLVDENGKPLCSNQSVRDAEVGVRLKGHEGYQKLGDKLREFYSARDKNKVDAEYFAKMFSVVKNDWFMTNQREVLELNKQVKQKELE